MALESEIERLKSILAPIQESIVRAEALGRKVGDWVSYAKALELDAGGAVGTECERLRTALAKLQADFELEKAERDRTWQLMANRTVELSSAKIENASLRALLEAWYETQNNQGSARHSAAVLDTGRLLRGDTRWNITLAE